MRTYGDRLRGAMERRGMKEAELIRVSGINQGTVQGYYGLLDAPRPVALFLRLARALGVRPEWLAFGEAPMEPERAGDPTALRQLFADTLRVTRHRRGFARPEDLARAAGLHPHRLKDFEAARLEPSLDELCALREALGAPIDYLVAGEGSTRLPEGEARPDALHEAPLRPNAGPAGRDPGPSISEE